MLQQNTNIVSLISTEQTIEERLKKMKRLDSKMKELKAEYEQLKGFVITDYFSENEEYKTAKGLLLASYKKQNGKSFNQTEFKKDHPDVFKLYQYDTVKSVFLLK